MTMKGRKPSNCKGLSLQPVEKIQVKGITHKCVRLNPLPQMTPTLKFSNASEWGCTGSPNPPKIGLEGEEFHLIQERGSHSDIPARKLLPGRGQCPQEHSQKTAGSMVG